MYIVEFIVSIVLFYSIPALWLFGGSMLLRRIATYCYAPKPQPVWPAPQEERHRPQAEQSQPEAEQQLQQVSICYFPLLDLSGSGPFTRAEVLEAYRRRAKVFHPDHGGWQERFIALVAERDRALGLCHC